MLSDFFFIQKWFDRMIPDPDPVGSIHSRRIQIKKKIMDPDSGTYIMFDSFVILK